MLIEVDKESEMSIVLEKSNGDASKAETEVDNPRDRKTTKITPIIL